MARTAPVADPAAEKSKEQIQVLNPNPVPQEVDMSPPNGRLDGASAPVDRASINPDQVAPVVRSALDAPVLRMGAASFGRPVLEGSSDEDAPKVRTYRVEKTTPFVDRTSGGRSVLREGKEIKDQHYVIRDLQRQGVKLRDITDVDPNAPL